MLSTLRRTLFALLACASFIVHAAAPDEITESFIPEKGLGYDRNCNAI